MYCFVSVGDNFFVFTSKSCSSMLNFSLTANLDEQWEHVKLYKILAAEITGLVGPPGKRLWCLRYLISGAKTSQNFLLNIYVHMYQFSAKLEMVEWGPLVHLTWNDPTSSLQVK